MLLVLNTFVTILDFTLTVVGAFLFTLVANKTTHFGVELGSLHADLRISDLALGNNTALFGNSLSGHNVITSNHTDGDASFLASFNGTWNFTSDDIVDSKDSNEDKITFLNIFDFCFLRFVVFLSTLILFNIAVGKSNGS